MRRYASVNVNEAFSYRFLENKWDLQPENKTAITKINK